MSVIGIDSSRLSTTPYAEPSVALVEAAGAERMRDQRVETEEQTHGEDAHAHEERTADADRADRFGADPADHQRIDQSHRHPAELRHHHRHRQGEHRPEFLTESRKPGRSANGGGAGWRSISRPRGAAP